MDKRAKDENAAQRKANKQTKHSAEGLEDGEIPYDGVVGDRFPFRFIIGEEAKARSLNGIAYGIAENGKYFVIADDGDTVSGLLVHALIKRNVEDGILPPIADLARAGAKKVEAQKK